MYFILQKKNENQMLVDGRKRLKQVVCSSLRQASCLAKEYCQFYVGKLFLFFEKKKIEEEEEEVELYSKK